MVTFLVISLTVISLALALGLIVTYHEITRLQKLVITHMQLGKRQREIIKDLYKTESDVNQQEAIH